MYMKAYHSHAKARELTLRERCYGAVPICLFQELSRGSAEQRLTAVGRDGGYLLRSKGMSTMKF